MKLSLPVVCLFSVLFFLNIGLAGAAMSPINLTVKSVSVDEKKDDDKKNDSKGETEQRKLEATLKNNGKETAAGAEVHFYFIGRTVGSQDQKVLTTEKKTQDLPAGETVVVESKVAKAVYIAAHTPERKKDSKERPERVKASGDKLSGWAVRVKSGGELVAEAYSSPALKSLVLGDAE